MSTLSASVRQPVTAVYSDSSEESLNRSEEGKERMLMQFHTSLYQQAIIKVFI